MKTKKNKIHADESLGIIPLGGHGTTPTQHELQIEGFIKEQNKYKDKKKHNVFHNCWRCRGRRCSDCHCPSCATCYGLYGCWHSSRLNGRWHDVHSLHLWRWLGRTGSLAVGRGTGNSGQRRHSRLHRCRGRSWLRGGELLIRKKNENAKLAENLTAEQSCLQYVIKYFVRCQLSLKITNGVVYVFLLLIIS